MPTDPEKVRLWGKTGSDLYTFKTARLTHNGLLRSPSFFTDRLHHLLEAEFAAKPRQSDFLGAGISGEY
jgi:hypothetical protein